MRAADFVAEKKWSAQRKRSINCARPRGFSQKAHCAGRKKTEDVTPRAVLTTKKPCERTRAAECACESVNQITESAQTVTAICVLEHSDRVKGTILMKQQPDSPTLIVGRITGLGPGLHGFHIHEFGDLSRGCESAGQHYNPDGTDHGDLDRGHVGDLGNITADAQGTAEFSIVAERVDLMGDRSVVGRAIVVHEDQDDLGLGGDTESLKTGNAGDRLACGVITLKQTVTEAARVTRKPGQPAGSNKHSDLYTDENPRGTIHGLKFATPEDARASVRKIRSSGRSHAHKIQAAVAMEQRARVAGKATAAGVYRKFINSMKKKTTQEQQLAELMFRGSECTQDCSGHTAGHEWYGRKLRLPNSSSDSFNRGAAIAAAGQ